MKYKLYHVDRGADREAFTVGFNGVVKIEKIDDGEGPMGHYDVIYVFKNSKWAFAAMPAHQCQYWESLDTKEDDPK